MEREESTQDLTYNNYSSVSVILFSDKNPMESSALFYIELHFGYCHPGQTVIELIAFLEGQ